VHVIGPRLPHIRAVVDSNPAATTICLSGETSNPSKILKTLSLYKAYDPCGPEHRTKPNFKP